MSKVNSLDVTILDRELRVSCPDDERAELLDAVAYLDKKMREIRDAGKIASVERIAIMAALNITQHKARQLKPRVEEILRQEAEQAEDEETDDQ